MKKLNTPTLARVLFHSKTMAIRHSHGNHYAIACLTFRLFKDNRKPSESEFNRIVEYMINENLYGEV